MERRKANRCSYNKLASKDPRTVSVTTLRRSRSMRASFRMLKGKLNQTNITTSPFKFNTPLHKRAKNYERFPSDEEKDSEIKDIEETRKTSEKLFKFTPSPIIANDKMHDFITCDNRRIEDLMSALPMGDVPRKACKLLQIPETYCRKYLSELQQEQKLKQLQQQQLHQQQQQNHYSSTSCYIKDSRDDLYYVQSNNRKNHIYEDLSKTVGQGIYGTTRLRTATIRKPMPYLNSSRCFLLNFSLTLINSV